MLFFYYKMPLSYWPRFYGCCGSLGNSTENVTYFWCCYMNFWGKYRARKNAIKEYIDKNQGVLTYTLASGIQLAYCFLIDSISVRYRDICLGPILLFHTIVFLDLDTPVQVFLFSKKLTFIAALFFRLFSLNAFGIYNCLFIVNILEVLALELYNLYKNRYRLTPFLARNLLALYLLYATLYTNTLCQNNWLVTYGLDRSYSILYIIWHAWFQYAFVDAFLLDQTIANLYTFYHYNLTSMFWLDKRLDSLSTLFVISAFFPHSSRFILEGKLPMIK
jgi:hypothetical protein